MGLQRREREGVEWVESGRHQMSRGRMMSRRRHHPMRLVADDADVSVDAIAGVPHSYKIHPRVSCLAAPSLARAVAIVDILQSTGVSLTGDDILHLTDHTRRRNRRTFTRHYDGTFCDCGLQLRCS